MPLKKIGFIALFLILCWSGGLWAGGAQLRINEPVHDFGEVGEGEVVSHEFILTNSGTEALQIQDVRPGWGCAVARFDRVIPPGGEGKAVLRVDLRGYQGPVQKSATIISNASGQPNAQLTMKGRVRPLIEIKPGPFVQFSASAAGADEKTLDLLAVEGDFQLLEVHNGLEGKVRVQWETVISGRHYRVKISNLQKEGNYFGLIRCRTNHPQKPEIVIRVSGHFPNPQPKKNEN